MADDANRVGAQAAGALAQEPAASGASDRRRSQAALQAQLVQAEQQLACRVGLADPREAAARGGAARASSAPQPWLAALLQALWRWADAHEVECLRLIARSEGSRIEARDGTGAQLALQCSACLVAALQGACDHEAGVQALAGRRPAAEGEFFVGGEAGSAPGAYVQCSALPSGHGLRTMLLRVRRRPAAVPGMSTLGFEAQDQQRLLHAAQAPQGLLLVAGPARAGRTTTLYALAETLGTAAGSVQSLEASPPLPHPGWQQFRWARAHRAGGVALGQVLRNAPDVLLFDVPLGAGNLRQLTGAVAQGCRVLTSVAAERAAQVFLLLEQLGLARREAAATVVLAMAQRLVPRLCPACRRADDSAPWRAAMARAANSWLHGQVLAGARAAPAGCAQCQGTGHQGRALLYEMIEVDGVVRALVEEGAAPGDLTHRLAREGRSLWDQGLRLMARGEISLATLRACVRAPA